ncbi:hypothetical protein ACWOAH_02620 [Vagococcus vulneris]|uniref:Uncharacterized protein n=1 Tax=Vagococcus vulneris TaxID=1977869 RepID=A0A430A0Z6_9ENTE|nr:hypothetical protein [Vagococcus vulneris]RSU00050.1 hypothetical protein CBF37_01750 [Vagococcus vulneris]
MAERKLLKSEKIRIKNDELRAKGKDPLKGSNPMINTGMVGINKANIGIKDEYNSNYMDNNSGNPVYRKKNDK